MTLAQGSLKEGADSAIGINNMTTMDDDTSPKGTPTSTPVLPSKSSARPQLVTKRSYQTEFTSRNESSLSLQSQGSLKRPAGMGSPSVHKHNSANLSRSSSAASKPAPPGRPYQVSQAAAEGPAPVFRSPFAAGYVASSARGTEPAMQSNGRIRSHVRNLSRNGDGLDLSKTTAENEMMTGLGISRNSTLSHARSTTDMNTNRFSGHSTTRSAGGNSVLGDDMNFSFKTTTNFVHPGRQQQASIRSRRSQNLRTRFQHQQADEEVEPLSEDAAWQPPLQNSESPTRLSQIHTTTSIANLQTMTQPVTPMRRSGSISSLRSIGLLRRQSTADLGTTPPSRRGSVDKAFSFLSRTCEPEDPAVRRASIVAARRAFEEKEMAKERRRQEADEKAREKMEARLSRRGSEAVTALPMPTRRGSEAVTALPMFIKRQPSIAEYNAMDEKMGMQMPYQYTATVNMSAPLYGEVRNEEEEQHQQHHNDEDEEDLAAKDATLVHQLSKTKVAKGKLHKFTAWGKTRLLSVK